ncbi:hypothetical protein SAMN05660443_0277 [Marinospirillum celere]|uniref:DUF4190 domain-containing protein n=1 Tax=Marinospirillum celere TaxID=1122252 RepID=A0A1I1E1V1_9GAMM|nr:hypothetical protein [Marinospirillum celere]SFB81175.1 hypothetical protein SAMN05660443_0277 [Marinospirillum celere]
MNSESEQPKETITRKNHNLSIVAITLALLGAFLAGSPFAWLLVPAVIAGGFAYKGIKREPERYSGILFVLAAWLLSLVVGGLHLLLYITS